MAAFREEDVRKIVKLEKASALQMLAIVLKVKGYDDDLRTAIYIDYLYDSIMFSFEKGFPLNQITSVVNFAQDFLHDCQGKPLSEAVRHYRNISEHLISGLGERNYKVFTDYIFSTFMSHYQLFTFVFSHDQDASVPHVLVDVCPPEPPPEMKDGKPEDVWKYENTIHTLEDEEIKKIAERVTEKEKIAEEELQRKKMVAEKLSTVEQPLTKETLADLIKDVLRAYTTSVKDNLVSTVQEVRDDLDLMLEKTRMPRPPTMGPPPRYKLRTPIDLIAKTPSKSRQPKSRDQVSGGSNRPQKSTPKAGKNK